MMPPYAAMPANMSNAEAGANRAHQLAGDAHQSTVRLRDQIVAAEWRIRPGLAVSGMLRYDARIAFGDVVVCDPSLSAEPGRSDSR
jgi:hypothetical protein